jgi:hypothetical protein
MAKGQANEMKRMSRSVPRTLVAVALMLAASFALVHAFGWRNDVAFFSGTPPDSGYPELALLRGAAYVVLYLAFLVVSPTLLITAGLVAAGQFVRRRLSSNESRHEMLGSARGGEHV